MGREWMILGLEAGFHQAMTSHGPQWIRGSCQGFYHYADTSCNYACLLTEGFYWSLTSLLGGQDACECHARKDQYRCCTISDEWRPCTSHEMRSLDFAGAAYRLLAGLDPSRHQLGYAVPVVPVVTLDAMLCLRGSDLAVMSGRPGSRKHRRYTHSVDLVNSLRRVMVSRGEENLPSDVDEVEEERPQARPSVFYRLLESEGANALDAWAAAEARRGRSPRVRAKDAAPRMAEERTRQVRRTFRENWQYLSQSQSSQELIAKLEQLAQDAFGTPESQLQDMLWQLLWTGEELATKAGAPPASEMQLEGLDPSERKVVHQLARLIGLHSESRSVEEETSAKVLTLRPRGCQASSWSAPFSVAQVLSAEVVTA
eukprot:s256_g20.t1